jgi:aminopeptidase N
MSTEPKTIYLKDYKAPDLFIEKVNLYFNIYNEKTIVTQTSTLKKNPQGTSSNLFLNGDNLKILSLKLNGKDLSPSDYEKNLESLTIFNCKDQDTIEIQTEIYPHLNTALEGLYQSGTMLCTQNEPEGFRKITYYVDRPDNMASFTTTVEGDKSKYPSLLSNGNKIATKDLGTRHSVTWEDPFKKPSYLFALVAGDFDLLEDTFTTMSGRKVKLEIYVDKGDLDKTHHAMESLKKSMKWDEETFGLEYDLDIYMIVAVSSFNMGAMENKGLNIFNSAYVLANPKTATDTDFELIEGVIGHEYFHNWTGNRVTCRDWFQLTLKEGLTVFRDQEFSADMSSRGVKRISDVTVLRNRQFAEDASPNAHPIKPSSYIEINNFYTPTVYEKGAEVIRMIHTLIGKDNFRKGMDLYFKTFDGQAVTTEDFVWSMEKASGKDLSQFKNWYHKSGTPHLSVQAHFDEKTKNLKLTIEQSEKQNPYHLPFKVALYNSQGKTLHPETTLELKNTKDSFDFPNLSAKPILSLNRSFSAPVKINYEHSFDDLFSLYAYDHDEFNRYEAGQKLMHKLIMDQTNSQLNQSFVQAYLTILADNKIDPAFKADLLKISSESELNDSMSVPNYDLVHKNRELFSATISKQASLALLKTYDELKNDHFSLEFKMMGRRALKNQVLNLLSYNLNSEVLDYVKNQFLTASNMTDELSALRILCNVENNFKDEALDRFYVKWKHEALVLDKWFAVQSTSKLPNTLKKINELTNHKDFSTKVPNRFRALVQQFAMNNLVHFHAQDGSGYSFIADKVIQIDSMNPQVASRLVNYSFNAIKRVDENRKTLMQAQLKRILSTSNLSKDTFEIVSKSLK